MHDHAVHVGRTGVDDPAAALVHHQVGEVPEGVGDVIDVDPALLQRLAGVPALDEGDLLAVALEQVGDPAEQRGALGDGGTGPVALVEGPAGGRDRRVGVLGTALGHQLERRRVGGVEDLPRLAGCGGLPHPVYVNGLD